VELLASASVNDRYPEAVYLRGLARGAAVAGDAVKARKSFEDFFLFGRTQANKDVEGLTCHSETAPGHFCDGLILIPRQ